MKLLVFAHTPPPHHGQSYMVQLMVEGLGGDCRTRQGGRSGPTPAYPIACYHVNARLSRKLEEIGNLRISKFVLLLGYCLQAVWCRFRYGISTLYYIPAPGKKSALLRDWVVMVLCRPFFKRVILHWHAAGLAKWLETAVLIRPRALNYRLMKNVDLSIVLSRYNRADAEKILSRKIRVVSNGIPDPCPDFAKHILPRRNARFAARRQLLAGQALSTETAATTGSDPYLVRILYMAHCTREKGLFDTLSGVVLANKRLALQQSPVSLRLIVTGSFVLAEEKTEFDRQLAKPEVGNVVEYLGFVTGEQKNKCLREADLFCFPTYYQNENQPVNLIEAMAFGLPILTTRWRSLPELFPADYQGLVDIRSPYQIAQGLLGLMTCETGEGFRDTFLRSFTIEKYLSGLTDAFLELERGEVRPAPAPALEAVQR